TSHSAGGTTAVATGTGGTASGGGSGGEAPTGWRSELYPDDWSPGFTSPSGHQIQDYSYAGYKNSEAPIGMPVVSTLINVVTDQGADPSGTTDATAAVNAAIAAASGAGGIVYFPAGEYRFDGVLLISKSNVVLKGAGSTQTKLFFTKTSTMSFDSHVTFRGSNTQGPDLLLAADAAPFDTTIKVADASSLTVGDDLIVGFSITSDFVQSHKMNGTWDTASHPFFNKWQPFFRRHVVSLDTNQTPHEVVIDVPIRYPVRMSDGASLRRHGTYLSECGVQGMALGNAATWDEAWSLDQVHILELDRVKDCWIDDVISYDPPTGPTSGNGKDDHLLSGGVLVRRSKRVTVANSEMHRGQHKGGGGNGYLFEVRQSSEVLFVDLKASKGRHNFIQNWGFGNSGCVWLRVQSSGANAWLNKNFPGLPGFSEFHHSLSLGNLVDSSTFDDGWSVVNRGSYSSGAGHSGTETIMWNTRGNGVLRSRQFDMGYVVGTKSITVQTSLGGFLDGSENTEPEDFTEGIGDADTLYPQSLFESQLAKRLAP
ncbi:MAG: glycosyl hydrolase family 28-related protein, partial [Polyangiaceae bacterium]